MSFYDVLEKINIDSFKSLVDTREDRDVERALTKKSTLGIDDFASLISENARRHYLREMVAISSQLTVYRQLGGQ